MKKYPLSKKRCMMKYAGRKDTVCGICFKMLKEKKWIDEVKMKILIILKSGEFTILHFRSLKIFIKIKSKYKSQSPGFFTSGRT